MEWHDGGFGLVDLGYDRQTPLQEANTLTAWHGGTDPLEAWYGGTDPLAAWYDGGSDFEDFHYDQQTDKHLTMNAYLKLHEKEIMDEIESEQAKDKELEDKWKQFSPEVSLLDDARSERSGKSGKSCGASGAGGYMRSMADSCHRLQTY